MYTQSLATLYSNAVCNVCITLLYRAVVPAWFQALYVFSTSYIRNDIIAKLCEMGIFIPSETDFLEWIVPNVATDLIYK